MVVVDNHHEHFADVDVVPEDGIVQIRADFSFSASPYFADIDDFVGKNFAGRGIDLLFRFLYELFESVAFKGRSEGNGGNASLNFLSLITLCSVSLLQKPGHVTSDFLDTLLSMAFRKLVIAKLGKDDPFALQDEPDFLGGVCKYMKPAEFREHFRPLNLIVVHYLAGFLDLNSNRPARAADDAHDVSLADLAVAGERKPIQPLGLADRVKQVLDDGIAVGLSRVETRKPKLRQSAVFEQDIVLDCFFAHFGPSQFFISRIFPSLIA